MTNGDRHHELHAHLQSRIPNPGADYWETVDEQLHAVEKAQSPRNQLSADGPAAAPPVAMDDGGEATGADMSSDQLATDEPWWRDGRNLAIAAALGLVLVLGAFALANRSSDSSEDTATTNEQAAADESAGAGAEAADGATGQTSAGTPLTALQARLAGQTADDGSAIATAAGPYCFSSDDALVFPANELGDRRALIWMEVGPDGFVTFYAMQGDVIVIAGSGYPNEAGVLTSQPIPLAGATGGLTETTLIITDTAVQFGSTSVLALVDCATVQSRVDQLFALIEGPSFVDNGVAWPPDDAVLSSAGLGPMRIGMTVSELSTVLGTQLEIETIDIATAGECGWIADSDAISNTVWTLVELTSATDGILRRVTVTDPRWSTPSGGVVGLSEQQILDIFPGQIESSPHVYVEGTYLTYIPASDADPNTVQFVSEGGTIAQIHAGDRNWVGLVEGCA